MIRKAVSFQAKGKSWVQTAFKVSLTAYLSYGQDQASFYPTYPQDSHDR